MVSTTTCTRMGTMPNLLIGFYIILALVWLFFLVVYLLGILEPNKIMIACAFLVTAIYFFIKAADKIEESN